MKQTILITGANGFIGSNICRHLLAAGYECRVLVRTKSGVPSGCDIVLGEFENTILAPDIFRNVHAVVHCAAHVHKMGRMKGSDNEEYFRVNRDLTQKLAQSAISVGIKMFIFLSSTKVMGDHNALGKIYTEEDTPMPTDSYGQSKYEAEKILKELYISESELQCVVLRLPMVYGPANKGNMISLIATASRGIPLPLSAARGKRSMIYIGNICSAIETLLAWEGKTKNSWECFNLTDTIDITSKQLYRAIYGSFRNGTGILWFPEILVNLVRRIVPLCEPVISRLFNCYRFSSKKFQKTFEWSAPFSFEEGIAETITWYKKKSINQ